MPHTFDPVILREYDIRGVADATGGKQVNLGTQDAVAIGRAFGTLVRKSGGKVVAVGYDGRVHSPVLEKALVEGLNSTGCDVVRIGLGPTPMLFFATKKLPADAGIMVTGSHNPPDQNGFKMLIDKNRPHGGPVYGKRILEMAEIAANDAFEKGKGTSRQIDLRDDYVDFLLANCKTKKEFKIAWDCGNGASSEIIQRLTKKLPGKHTLLFATIDGTFPNHKPDPSNEKNLVDLQKKVREEGCDMGIAFDGDADRIGAIDGQSRLLAGDQLLAVYATEILKEKPGAPVIADVKASQSLFDGIQKLGGKPIMWKTGNSLIKVKMAELDAPLAGEMSGHIFFGDNNGFDDGIYAAMKLISLVGNSGKSLAEWRDSLPPMVSTPEQRFPIEETRKFAVVEKVKAQLQKEGARVNDVDGVRVMTEDGWWLLRASNTEGLLVTRAEARTKEGLARLEAQLSTHLKEAGIALPKAS